MKKSNYVAMILGTVSGVLFALGMCMALIPEWNTKSPLRFLERQLSQFSWV